MTAKTPREGNGAVRLALSSCLLYEAGIDIDEADLSTFDEPYENTSARVYMNVSDKFGEGRENAISEASLDEERRRRIPQIHELMAGEEILEKVRSQKGIRYLVNTGLLESFIYACGKARRWDLATKAFNIIACVPKLDSTGSSKGYHSAIASLAFAAAMCDKRSLSKALLNEYYAHVFASIRQADVELLISLSRGNIYEVLEILDTLQFNRGRIDEQTHWRVLDLAGRELGLRGVFKVYSLFLQTHYNWRQSKARIAIKVIEECIRKASDGGIRGEDIAFYLLFGIRIPLEAMNEIVDFVAKLQFRAPPEHRLERGLALAKMITKTDKLPRSVTELLLDGACHVKDLHLALAVHTHIFPNIPDPQDHYVQLVKLALHENENLFVGTLLREFRVAGFIPDENMSNLLLIYAARASSASQALESLSRMPDSDSPTRSLLMEEVLRKICAETMKDEAEKLWPELLSRTKVLEDLDQETIQAMVYMYRDIGDCVGVEKLLKQCTERNYSLKLELYSTIQQMHLQDGNLERAKELVDEAKSRHFTSESNRIESFTRRKRQESMIAKEKRKLKNERRKATEKLKEDQRNLGLVSEIEQYLMYNEFEVEKGSVAEIDEELEADEELKADVESGHVDGSA